MRFIAAALCCVLLGAPAFGWEPPLRTVAERSDYRATSTSAEVEAFVEELAASAERAQRLSLGKSHEGKDIPLLIVADPPVKTAAEARRSGKLVVLLVGNIHAGEVDGKEALLALAREIATAEESPLLKDLVLAFVPNFNPDGNDRMGKGTRPGQKGPEEGQGVRENAQGLDLNRDYVKLESPEVRALVRFMNEWDPAVVLDAHTTNGSFHRYTLTYGGPKHPAGDAAIVEFVRDTMLPAIGKATEEASGYKTFFYGDFVDRHTRWMDYPDHPRYGAPYVGLRNRIAVLTESYSYAPYKDRVLAQTAFIRETLGFAAEHKRKIRDLIRKADEATMAAGREPKGDETLALRTRMAAAPEKATVLGYVEEERNGKAAATDEERSYEVELMNRFETTVSVSRPFAYLLPASYAAVVENLQRHGIRVEELREDVELDVEVYLVERVVSGERAFQGHRLTSVEGVTPRTEPRRVPAGTVVVRTAQPLGTLAAYLLEPRAEDGLAAWNFFDDALLSAEGAEFPVLRLTEPRPILTAPARPLAETREKGKRVTFDLIWGRNAPNFNGSPMGGVTWLPDGEHFLVRREGKLWKVNAERGRAEPAFDPEPVAAALAKLPAIDKRTAGSLAERALGQTTKDRSGGLIEHESDLYYVALDGSRALRLTSTPEREELATFSPDGSFVAFVRDNDLWVVDVQTGTERALTTGGTDLLRNGKADWVYYEEIFNRNWRVYWWSPDSSRIAFMQVDSSPVTTFTIVNDVEEDQAIERTPFPKPGTPNPVARIGIVSVAGGSPRWADLSGYDAGNYLVTGLDWWPDSSAVCALVTNRTQTWLDVLSVPPGGGEPRRLLRDRTEAWVDPTPTLKFFEDGSFLLSSERDGWKHLYWHAKDGKLKNAVTGGEWEVRSLEHVDGKGGADSWVYFAGTRDSHIGVNLYRARLDGSAIERLTSGQGSHRASVSPDGELFTDSWSSPTTPTRVELRRTDGGGLVRTLDTNPVHDLEEYELGERRLVRIPTEDGFTLEGSVLLPPGFDEKAKYPVWFMTYAGPQAPTVSESWPGGLSWDQALASEGFIVFRADPRSASGKGARSAWTAYKRLGEGELKDIETAIAWLLREHPQADAERIGMSGHSYGGFMTAYALTHSDVFAAGIAGAPVTSWRDYDSIYTERYMSTPGENPEGYKATSVVEAAGDLHGELLLIHGLLDDNVHAQNSVRLIRALQRANKKFRVMVYPEARHGIWGEHYRELMVDFIRETLGGPERAGSGDADGSPEPEPEVEARGGPRAVR